MTKRRYESIINFFISRVYQPLRLTLVDRFHPFLRFSLANFRRLSSPFVSKTQKLLSRTRRPKKELRSQKKKEATFSSSQRTKNIQRLKTKCSRSRLPAARYVHSVLIFFRANVVSKRGFRVRVRVASGGSVARNLRAKFFRLRKADWLRFSRHPSIFSPGTTRRRRAFSVSRSFRSASSDVFAKKRYRLVLFGRSFDGLRGVRPLRAEMDFI